MAIRTAKRVTCVLGSLALVSLAGAATVVPNFTGLPAYPNLNRAAMDDLIRIEGLGHQCARFVGITFDSIDAVVNWYRRNLHRPSETDLANDDLFGSYRDLNGIKLSTGVNYVAIFTAHNRPTTIELHRCEGL